MSGSGGSDNIFGENNDKRSEKIFGEIGDALRESVIGVPDGFASNIMRKIAEQKHPAKKKYTAQIALAACFALIIGAGAWLMSQKPATGASVGGSSGYSDSPVPRVSLPYDFDPNGDAGAETAENSPAVSSGLSDTAPPGGFMAEANIYQAGEAKLLSNASRDVLSSMDQETLDAFFMLLDFSRVDTLPDMTAEPVYIIELEYLDGSAFGLKLWILGGALYSGSPGGEYYKSACDLGGFLDFIERNN